MSPEPIDPGRIRETMTDPRWAALARADLSLQAIGTWSPQLPRDTRLLVPADVQALVVRSAGAVSAVPTETVVPVSHPGDPDEKVLPQPPKPFEPLTQAQKRELHRILMPQDLGCVDSMSKQGAWLAINQWHKGLFMYLPDHLRPKRR